MWVSSQNGTLPMTDQLTFFFLYYYNMGGNPYPWEVRLALHSRGSVEVVRKFLWIGTLFKYVIFLPLSLSFRYKAIAIRIKQFILCKRFLYRRQCKLLLCRDSFIAIFWEWEVSKMKLSLSVNRCFWVADSITALLDTAYAKWRKRTRTLVGWRRFWRESLETRRRDIGSTREQMGWRSFHKVFWS